MRGVAAELASLGHEVAVYEPAGASGLGALCERAGEGAITDFRRSYSPIQIARSALERLDLDLTLAGAESCWCTKARVRNSRPA